MGPDITEALLKDLFALQDLGYREFTMKLIPTVPFADGIGIRVPLLRKFAKVYSNNPESDIFLSLLPHRYLEENHLQMLLIQEKKDYEECIRLLAAFLPYVNNWATCDMGSPKCFKEHKTELMTEIKQWLKSDHEYTVRYAIRLIMTWFLEEDFKPEYLVLVTSVKSDFYYVRMMQAWCLATALAKQYDSTLPILKNSILEPWTHNKTIQKAVESYRITPEQKTFLKSLRRTVNE